jgi:hypothetical protein
MSSGNRQNFQSVGNIFWRKVEIRIRDNGNGIPEISTHNNSSLSSILHCRRAPRFVISNERA